jgi:hypothetical protein
MTQHDHVHQDDHAHQAPPEDRGSSWTGYAIVKYGFILIITIVILFFVARYLLPLFD